MNLGIDLCGVALKNPVMTASGTFGSGEEYSEFVDLNKLGAVVTKGVANVPWEGNPTPRVAEVYGGMLNAIGLQNPGIDLFIDRDIPFLKKYDTKIIVNVCGHTTEEYIDVVERLSDQPVDLLEINISCPNVKEGGIAFGQNPKMVEEVTKEMKRHAKQPVIMKLSPNVTDITEMARAAEAGGADALSMINTITGMKIDIHRRCFALANRTGGMSGPAVHPVAVRMVYQSAQAVKIPIIGMGGIQTAEDAIEMILAGATAVSVGTANFYHPHATEEIVDGIRAYMERYQVEDVSQYWPVYLSFERTIELLKEQGMEPGTCLAPEKVERITFDVQNYFYEQQGALPEGEALAELQKTNPNYREGGSLVIEEPAAIRLLLGAIAEDDSCRMNYLCETVEGGLYCTIRTENEAGVGGMLIKNRITPEIAELFAGIPLNNGK